jgi:hypothetical protein
MFGFADYYVVATALAFGLMIIGITRLIERRRERNPMPHLVPTTPFMMVGALVVLVAIAFSLTLWRTTTGPNPDARASKNLSGDEIAEFKMHLRKCWMLPAGASSVQGVDLSIRIALDRRGGLAGEPELTRAPASLSGPVLLASAMRALQQCQPYDFLPATKYEQWRVLDLRFSSQGPSEVSTAAAHKDFRAQ